PEPAQVEVPAPKRPRTLLANPRLKPTRPSCRPPGFQAVPVQFALCCLLRDRILPLLVGFAAGYLGRRKAPPGWHLPRSGRTRQEDRWMRGLRVPPGCAGTLIRQGRRRFRPQNSRGPNPLIQLG